MIYLFIHQNFPGQYRQLARHLADQKGNTVYFITQPNSNEMEGVRKLVYQPPILGWRTCHPYTVILDDAIQCGLAAAAACRDLRDKGVRPDIIIGHAGWGETIFVKDVFPDTPLMALFEFYFHAQGADVDFDPEFESIFTDPARLRVKNAISQMAFDSVDWGHVATEWQRSVHPPAMRQRITAIHEGVDTDTVRPDPKASIHLARDSLTLTAKDEIVTYVARNLEPYRGFHTFMRALPEILRRRPKARAVIVGGDDVSYGAPPPPGSTFREVMLREVGTKLDMSRVHFLGQIDYASYLKVLQISSAHVYLSYPFVLSWSFVEAMAAGCLVIGSRTAPVMELLQDRRNGLSVDFFSAEELAERVSEALTRRKQLLGLRKAARQHAVQHYGLKTVILPAWEPLLQDLISGRRPQAAPVVQAPRNGSTPHFGPDAPKQTPSRLQPKVSEPQLVPAHKLAARRGPPPVVGCGYDDQLEIS